VLEHRYMEKEAVEKVAQLVSDRPSKLAQVGQAFLLGKLLFKVAEPALKSFDFPETIRRGG
jgi:hypothetical protein